jgi:cytochrome c-type biogenesis protein CcmH/NrfG
MKGVLFGEGSAVWFSWRFDVISVILLSLAITQGAPSQPPRDRAVTPRANVSTSVREAELQKRIAESPNGVAAYLELSKLQEDRGAFAEAELTLMRARQAAPGSKEAVLALMGLYNRVGDFPKTMEMLDVVEHMDPTDPAAPLMTATFYWDKAFRDDRLLWADAYRYVRNGIAATDRALALKADFVDALTYKNILLRMRANLEPDPGLKEQLIAEADALRNRAIELNKQRTAIAGDNTSVRLPPPPPPPPPPGGARRYPFEGMAAPAKIKA